MFPQDLTGDSPCAVFRWRKRKKGEIGVGGREVGGKRGRTCERGRRLGMALDQLLEQICARVMQAGDDHDADSGSCTGK